ncbi:MAG: class I SAM-dependent methyltransferase [Pseudomonadota bacterium]
MTTGGSLSGKLFVALTHLIPPLAPALWRWWYNTLARKDAAGELLFMNYGYADDTTPLTLAPADEPYRYPLQLYRQVVAGLDLTGRDVLEVGSGRGGGAAWLARTGQPRRYLGVDLSDAAIVWCRQRHALHNLEFRTGRADALPVDDESFDVVVNVESSHGYPDMAGFLAEVRRVLRTGGHFAFCDLRTPSAMNHLHARWRERGFEPVRQADITAQVLQALDRVAEARTLRIQNRVPERWRRTIEDFAGVRGSALYAMLDDGRLVYHCAVLRKL